jgi:hypothetical protein
MSGDDKTNSPSIEAPQEEQGYKTVFGLPEEVYVRTAASGNYTPTIHELDELAMENKVTATENRILLFIKSKTVYFRNTHIKLKRKDIQTALGIPQANVYNSVKSLVQKGYLLEKALPDNYFYYGLNPQYFKGIIVLRSVSEVGYRINRQDKLDKGLICYSKKPYNLYQKAIDLIANCYSETDPNARDYKGFFALKYILLKYISLNGLSDQKARMVTGIFDTLSNPEYMLKKFSQLMHDHPRSLNGMFQEIDRANREGTNGFGLGRLIKDPITHIVNSWPSMKNEWMRSLPLHTMDMSEEAIRRRSTHFEALQACYQKKNVIPFKKKKSPIQIQSGSE